MKSSVQIFLSLNKIVFYIFADTVRNNVQDKITYSQNSKYKLFLEAKDSTIPMPHPVQMMNIHYTFVFIAKTCLIVILS